MGRTIGILVGAATAASLTTALAPAASAAPCPDVEVVFARGTTEAPGVGPTGDAFVDSLRSRIGTKSMDVYPVDYPATTDFPKAMDGIRDASARVESMAANCPDTNIVLGGFSQGAAVAGFVTANVIPDGAPEGVPNPMPPDVAKHVAAVALFGKPNERFMHAINQPDVEVGPLYADKAIQLCVDDDFVCSSGRDFNAHTQYVETGMVDQAATFAAAKLAASKPPPAATPQTPAPASQPHLLTSAGPQQSTPPAAPPLSTVPVAPPPPQPPTPPQQHLQQSPETILSCTTVCHVVGPE
jgi:hypothetical protein